MKSIVALRLEEPIVDKAINSPVDQFHSKDYILEREDDGFRIVNRKKPELDTWVPSVRVKVVYRSDAPPTAPATPSAKRAA